MLEQPVDRLLDRRYHPDARRRRWIAASISIGLHLAWAALFLVAPVLAARQKQPLEFVPIQIVPVQALGVPEPAPAAAPTEPARPKPPPPEPAREPEPRRPEPERKPAPQPEPPPRRSETPSREREASASPAEPAQRLGSPLGRATGTSPFGGAVAGLDHPDFVYNYYVEQMLAAIGSHWVRPPASQGVEAIVRFRIGRQGEVTELELLKSSGLASFDLAGLRAVEGAAPLPPLPRSFPHDSLGVRLVIR